MADAHLYFMRNLLEEAMLDELEEITKEDAECLKTELESKYDECDVYMHFGGQPVYYYILSVE